MLLFLLLVASCAAAPQDLSNQMFTFPQESRTALVKLTPSKTDLSALTVCLRYFTDLQRPYSLFSLALPSKSNAFLIFKLASLDAVEIEVEAKNSVFEGLDFKLNKWHSVCGTWAAESGLVQLWLDGKQSSRKFTTSGSNLNGAFMIILGQEQDSYGGDFDAKQSFVGMMSDVHMWDYILSPCEIQYYAEERSVSPGNVLNWNALQYQITDKVVVENKMKGCPKSI